MTMRMRGAPAPCAGRVLPTARGRLFATGQFRCATRLRPPVSAITKEVPCLPLPRVACGASGVRVAPCFCWVARLLFLAWRVRLCSAGAPPRGTDVFWHSTAALASMGCVMRIASLCLLWVAAACGVHASLATGNPQSERHATMHDLESVATSAESLGMPRGGVDVRRA